MIIGSRLLFYKELPSTNTRASLLLNENEQIEGTVIYTDYQTAGRGQKGNKWESVKGKNLLFSIILYPDSIIPSDQFILSMSISLGICDFLDTHFGGSVIKWPNDIYVKDDKIAGILIENSITGETLESSIVGIGLNINQENFPSGVGNVVSMKINTGKDYDRDICLREILSAIDLRYRQLLYGDRIIIRKEYISRLYRYNEEHLFRNENKIFKGKITDVLPSGQLKIEDENGKISHFSYKEVDYVK